MYKLCSKYQVPFVLYYFLLLLILYLLLTEGFQFIFSFHKLPILQDKNKVYLFLHVIVLRICIFFFFCLYLYLYIYLNGLSCYSRYRKRFTLLSKLLSTMVYFSFTKPNLSIWMISSRALLPADDR